MDHFTRRAVLKVGAVGAAGATAWASGVLQRTPGWTADAPTDPADVLGRFEGYGELVPDPDGILDLPAGFGYTILAAEGDAMSDGARPGIPDGMEYFNMGGGQFALCMNHEIRVQLDQAGALLTPGTLYPAGCSTLILNQDLSVADQFISQRNTTTNCAGGRSPWGTWLTCEEFTIPGTAEGLGRGYVWDVDPFTGENGPAYPAMGRFWHEAIAFDPATGIVYETEDQPDGLLYRFIPDTRDDLTAGRLEAMAVLPPRGRGDRLRVRWVDVTDIRDSETLRTEGAARGATPFTGNEGIIHFGGSIYFDEGEGGEAGLGRIWRYRPAQNTLELFYESGEESAMRQPDNIHVQPGTGDLIHCEDTGGDNANKLVLQDATGRVITFAQDRSGSEFAGACWSPDGRRLFVNIHNAGLTVCIEGPFREALAAERQRTALHAAPTGGIRRANGDQVARAIRDRGMTALETEAALALGMGHAL